MERQRLALNELPVAACEVAPQRPTPSQEARGGRCPEGGGSAHGLGQARGGPVERPRLQLLFSKQTQIQRL